MTTETKPNWTIPRAPKDQFHNEYGHLLTRSLIWETGMGTTETYLYTLHDHDKVLDNGKVLPSLKRLYIEMSDPLEYDFANKYFYNWDHWKRISEAAYMRDYLPKWRAEVEIKLQSEALKMIQAEAIADTKYSYGANKYLAEKGWLKTSDHDPLQKKSGRGAGRPSKAQIREEANRIASEEHDIDLDLKRLGLN